MPNEQTQAALEIVQARLERDPESYDQGEWGNTDPDCETPGCIAGHIVAGVDSARKGYERRLKAMADRTDPTAREDAIRDAATEALGLETAPRLFESRWPPVWIEKAGGEVHLTALEITGPSTEEALVVLEAVLTGRLDEVLEPSTKLYEHQSVALAQAAEE